MIRATLTFAVCCLLASCLAGEPPALANAECTNRKPCPGGQLCRDLKCYDQCLDAYDCGEGEACVGGLCESYAPGCAVDSQCADDFFCKAGTCSKRQELGELCETTTWCRSGFCADNVCCDNACEGACEACSFYTNGAFDGSCLPVPGGEDPREDCEGAAICDGAGACDIRGNGEPCAESFQCESEHCVDGVCCGTACTTACLACVESATGVDDGVCAAVSLGEDVRDACAGATACNGTGQCFAKAVAATCGNDYECASGSCVDGVCCDGACDGDCRACSASLTNAATGTCASVTVGLDPDSACAGDLACDGNGECFAKTVGDPCNAAYECDSGQCIDGVCCTSECDGTCQTCNGATPGTCANLVSAEDVGTCDSDTLASGCGTKPCACDGDAACKPSGAVPCSTGTQCLSGVCLGGTCCTTACSGGCLSCGSAQTGGAPGACLPVVAGTDPANACSGTSASLACDGSGACYDKENGEACTSANQCVSNFCADGVCCDAACGGVCRVCDGAGTNAPGANAGVCTAVSEGQDPDNECAGGAACNGSGGCYSKAAGATCSNNYECTNGVCCGGTCRYGLAAMTSPTTQDLRDVWVASSSKAWAVGNAGTVLEWNGTSWSIVAAGLTTNDLHAVYGSSSINVIAVGEAGTILRYNGSSWSTLSSGVTTNLNSVWVGSTSLAYAVGDSGTIRKWNGNAWSAMTSPYSGNLWDLWGDGANFYAVGSNSSLGSCTTKAAIKLTAGTWENLPTPSFCPTDITSAGGILYTVGRSLSVVCSSTLHRTMSWSALLGDSWSTHSGNSASDLWSTGNTVYYVYSGCDWHRAGYLAAGETTHYQWPYQNALSMMAALSGVGSCPLFSVGNSGSIRRF